MANSTVKKTGLYADLLADPGSATISGAPVKYEFRRPEDAAIELQKKKDGTVSCVDNMRDLLAHGVREQQTP